MSYLWSDHDDCTSNTKLENSNLVQLALKWSTLSHNIVSFSFFWDKRPTKPTPMYETKNSHNIVVLQLSWDPFHSSERAAAACSSAACLTYFSVNCYKLSHPFSIACSYLLPGVMFLELYKFLVLRLCVRPISSPASWVPSTFHKYLFWAQASNDSPMITIYVPQDYRCGCIIAVLYHCIIQLYELCIVLYCTVWIVDLIWRSLLRRHQRSPICIAQESDKGKWGWAQSQGGQTRS